MILAFHRQDVSVDEVRVALDDRAGAVEVACQSVEVLFKFCVFSFQLDDSLLGFSQLGLKVERALGNGKPANRCEHAQNPPIDRALQVSGHLLVLLLYRQKPDKVSDETTDSHQCRYDQPRSDKSYVPQNLAHVHDGDGSEGIDNRNCST